MIEPCAPSLYRLQREMTELLQTELDLGQVITKLNTVQFAFDFTDFVQMLQGVQIVFQLV